MKTIIKELFSLRIAVLSVVLAAILGVCAFSFVGNQQDAWADDGAAYIDKDWSAFTQAGNAYEITEGTVNLKVDFDAKKFSITNQDTNEIPAAKLWITLTNGDVKPVSIPAIPANQTKDVDIPDWVKKDEIKHVMYADIKVKVTFNLNGHGGTPPADLSISAGEVVSPMPTDPTETDWTFLGWFTDSGLTQAFDAAAPIQPTPNPLILNAKWEPVKITVTFEMNGHGTTPAALKIDKGTAAGDIAAPAADGYTFEGWFTDKGLTKAYDPAAILEANTTLYAKWKQNPDPKPAPAPAPAANDFSIVISKTDARTGKALAGADFTLKDSAGNVVQSWTTDGNGGVVINGLDRSTSYVLTETKAPDGYNREKDININFYEENGEAVVKIDQGGKAVPLANNNDGIASLNVKDLNGATLMGTSTTGARTGDNQNMPLASLCFAGAALVAGGVASSAYRKRHAA